MYSQGYLTLLNEESWQHNDESGTCTIFKETDLSDKDYFILHGPVKAYRNEETWLVLPKASGNSYYFDGAKQAWILHAEMKVEIKGKSIGRSKAPLPRLTKAPLALRKPRRD